MIPGFNPDTKSDEELHGIIADLTNKLNLAARVSYGTSAVEQIQTMISIIFSIVSERQQASQFEARLKSQKATIESDPDLANGTNKSKSGVRNEKTARKPVTRMVVQRSNTPTNQIQIDPTKDT